MPQRRQTNSAFIQQKNSETNKPIWLYRINISDTPEVSGEGDLFYAQYDVDVEYFKTDDGIDSPQTYLRFPIEGDGLSTNTEGVIDNNILTVSNVSREIMAFMQSRDLRGRKVTIRQVFFDTLGDDQAYMEDEYFIDYPDIDQYQAKFTLASKMDVFEITIPKRQFLPSCSVSFVYKGRGCWIESSPGVFTEPEGFSANSYPLILAETEFFASTNPVSVAAQFLPVKLTGLNLTTDKLLITIGTDEDEIDNLMGLTGSIIISSDRNNAENLVIDIADWGTFLTGWEDDEYELDLANFYEPANPFNPNTTHFINLVINNPSLDDVGLHWSKAKILIESPEGIGQSADICLKTFQECQRHNNTNRFGGFPNIPKGNPYYD